MGTAYIKLSWTDESSNETGFRIMRGSSPEDLTQIALVDAGTEVYYDFTISIGVTYYYQIIAVNDDGGASGNIISLNVEENLPKGGDLSLVSQPAAGQVSLSWSEIDDVIRYHIYGSYLDTDPVVLGIATTNSITLSGMRRNTKYYLYMVPEYENGVFGAIGDNLEVDTTNWPVTIGTGIPFLGTGDTESVRIYFTDLLQPLFDRLVLQHSANGTDWTTEETTAYDPSGAWPYLESQTPATMNDTDVMYFRIACQFTTGSLVNPTIISTVYSSQFTYTHAAELVVPGQVTNLAASVVDSEIHLTWSAPSGGGDVGGYEIQYTDGVEWLKLAGTDSSTLEYDDDTAPQGQVRTYRVAALNSAGYGTFSSTVAIEGPYIPPTVTIEKVGGHGLSITIDDLAEDEDGYTLYHGAPGNWIYLTDLDAMEGGSTTIHIYPMDEIEEYMDPESDGPYQILVTVVKDSASVAEYSESDLYVDDSDTDEPVVSFGSGSTFDVVINWSHSWGGSVPADARYLVWREDRSTDERTLIAVLPGDTTSFTDSPSNETGTYNGGLHAYFVQAKSDIGAGVDLWSRLKVINKTAAMYPPAFLHVSNQAPGFVILSWVLPDNTENIAYYEIERREYTEAGTEEWATCGIVYKSWTGYADSTAPANKSLEYRVRSRPPINSSMPSSGYSDIVRAFTDGTLPQPYVLWYVVDQDDPPDLVQVALVYDRSLSADGEQLDIYYAESGDPVDDGESILTLTTPTTLGLRTYSFWANEIAYGATGSFRVVASNGSQTSEHADMDTSFCTHDLEVEEVDTADMPTLTGAASGDDVELSWGNSSLPKTAIEIYRTVLAADGSTAATRDCVATLAADATSPQTVTGPGSNLMGLYSLCYVNGGTRKYSNTVRIGG